MSQWMICSFLCWMRVPIEEWTMHLGLPVVPEEYKM